MSKIIIRDLPADEKVSKEEMERIKGGMSGIGSSTGFPFSLDMSGSSGWTIYSPSINGVSGLPGFSGFPSSSGSSSSSSDTDTDDGNPPPLPSLD